MAAADSHVAVLAAKVKATQDITDLEAAKSKLQLDLRSLDGQLTRAREDNGQAARKLKDATANLESLNKQIAGISADITRLKHEQEVNTQLDQSVKAMIDAHRADLLVLALQKDSLEKVGERGGGGLFYWV